MSQACCQTALKTPRINLNSARLKKKGHGTHGDTDRWVHTPSHFVTHATTLDGPFQAYKLQLTAGKHTGRDAVALFFTTSWRRSWLLDTTDLLKHILFVLHCTL